MHNALQARGERNLLGQTLQQLFSPPRLILLTRIALLLMVLLFAVIVVGATPHDTYRGFAQPKEGYVIADDLVTVEDDLVFKTAYYSENGGMWKPLRLSGDVYTRSDRWLISRGTTVLPDLGAGEHYVITYSCELVKATTRKEANTWNCSQGQWQLHTINIEQGCERHNNSACYEDNVWWYNSCGEREDRKETCPNGCENNECIAPVDNTILLADGFERGIMKPFASISDGELSADNTQAHTGARSLKITSYGTYSYTDQDADAVGVVAPLQGGEIITFTTMAKGDEDVLAGLMITCLNENKVYWENSGGYEGIERPTTNDWSELAVSNVCPSWAEYVGVRLSARGSGRVWFDQPELTIGGGACYPDCTGKTCGGDGCGGSCGTCANGDCIEGRCSVSNDDYVVVYSNTFDDDTLGAYRATDYEKDWNNEDNSFMLNYATIVQNEEDEQNPTQVLEYFFMQGSEACDYQKCLSATHVFDKPYKELYFSYKIKLDESFACSTCKMPYLQGRIGPETKAGQCPTGYEDYDPIFQLKTRNGYSYLSNYIYHAGMWDRPYYQDDYFNRYGRYATSCEEMCEFTANDDFDCAVWGEGGDLDARLSHGKWYTITQRLVMNDIGLRNGYVETFIDGEYIASADNFEFTKTKDLQIDRLRFLLFESKGPVERNGWLWVDDITVFYYTAQSGEPRGQERSEEGRVLRFPTLE